LRKTWSGVREGHPAGVRGRRGAVSVDFTEGRLAPERRRNPGTGRACCRTSST
jgi:hypothetical protein